jgi:DNA-binding NarL/FixJ family response regulator
MLEILRRPVTSTLMARIRLLLVDDHILFRQSLSRLLASEADVDVVADCGTAGEALGVLGDKTVDIVLLDFDLGHDHGSQFITAARRAGSTAKILMVTAGMTLRSRRRPSALVPSQTRVTQRAGPGRSARGGRGDVGRRAHHYMDEPRPPQERPHLTEREQQVLRGVFEGLANKEIGGRLGVSESAVKATLQQLFRKTGVRTRSQLVRVAIEGSFATTRKP